MKVISIFDPIPPANDRILSVEIVYNVYVDMYGIFGANDRKHFLNREFSARIVYFNNVSQFPNPLSL